MYSSHAIRLESLKNWPGRVWFDICEVASAGLYYLDDENSRDRLRCAFCEFIVANWKRGENVWKVHAAFVPTCQHLLFCKGIDFVKTVLQNEENNAEFQLAHNTSDRSMYGHLLRFKELTSWYQRVFIKKSTIIFR
ncbi:baculoviral IAP repeat-containing protein 7-like isoform X2 [Mercenaria mercenaria]|uniref:baculoviral IAP repeat-containing protein 7-like isoform X2 n=1 Tax=Mercenaria mercenaria TaxID=6596 RepID=UPI00234F6246|nr:baculoviral IAP repeat-containing protein 7-like isoform X2 [Mercenaria mercenaria]